MQNQENNSLEDKKPIAMFAEKDAEKPSANAVVNTAITKNTKSVLRDDDSQVEICRNFLHNRCTRGSFCKFRHSKPDSREKKRSRSPIPNRAAKSPDVCRDFLNNMCDRGINCRYFHPPEDEIDKKPWFTLCYDFQNGKCTRHDCRFFHISPDDEESFRITGEVPYNILDQAKCRGIILEEQTTGSRPTCKDHLKGVCQMTPCRFRHVNRREYENAVYRTLSKELTELAGCDPVRRDEFMGIPHPGRYEPPALFNPNNDFGSRMPPGPFEDSPRGREDPFNRFGGGPGGPRGPGGSRGRGGPRGPGPYSRPYENNESEALQQDLRQLEDHLHQVKQEKDQRITALERQLSGFRDNGPFSGGPMQLDMDRLRKKNEELARDLAAKQSWEVIYNDTKAKLEAASVENQQLSNQLSSLNSKVSSMSGDLKSWEGFESFVKDQVFRSKDLMATIEAELSEPYAVSGASIILSQKDSWRQLQTILSQILKASSRNLDGPGYASNFGGSNLGASYNRF